MVATRSPERHSGRGRGAEQRVTPALGQFVAAHEGRGPRVDETRRDALALRGRRGQPPPPETGPPPRLAPQEDGQPGVGAPPTPPAPPGGGPRPPRPPGEA